jgi:hypothetical protein
MGGFYPGPKGPAPAPVPFSPPGDRGPAPPSRPEFIDRIENGHAVLLDDRGNARTVPAEPHWREGMMTSGPPPVEDGTRARLGAADDGRDFALPTVPAAPGPPPPIPPGVDSFIGKPKGKPKTQGRRRIVP